MSATFASLRYVNYRYWFAATLIASTGTWLQRVAQDWYVLTVLTDHDSSQVGIVTALQFLPIILFSAWAGVLADRIPGRRLLQCTQTGIGVVSLIMGLVVLTGTGQLWHQYVLAFVSGTISAMDTPARQAFVGELVPLDKMANAVALNSTAFHAARLIGPASAGLFIDWWGVGPVFLIDAGMFAAPVIALMLMRGDRLYPRTLVPRARGQLREAVAYVRRRTDILIILVLIAIVSALGMNFQMTSALMATTVFGKTAGSFGILSSFMAFGSILGATGAARRIPRLRTIIPGCRLLRVRRDPAGFVPFLLVVRSPVDPDGFWDADDEHECKRPHADAYGSGDAWACHGDVLACVPGRDADWIADYWPCGRGFWSSLGDPGGRDRLPGYRAHLRCVGNDSLEGARRGPSLFPVGGRGGWFLCGRTAPLGRPELRVGDRAAARGA